MPTYEYECTKCGHSFEEFQSIHEPPIARCPQCRGKVKRIVGAGAGIVFRGSGWYATDSRPKRGKTEDGKAPSTPPEKPAAAKDGGKGSGDAAA